MSTSMVKGNPLKLMVQFALPLLLGNLLQQTYNIIDAAIVGQILGAKALASVGATSSVQFLVLGFCIGICAGFGVPVAKYFGAEKKDTMRNYIFNGAVLTAGAAVVLTSACVILCNQILHILSVPEDIYVNAYRYILIIFLGIPFSLLYNYLSSILRSVGDSRTPFIFLAFAAVLNIFLDLFCIVEMGMRGCCHCDHHGTGHQWYLLSDCDLTENGTDVAWKRRPPHEKRSSTGTSSYGNSHRIAVFYYCYRKYGNAVCKQRTGKCVCICVYSSYEDQAVCHVPV